MERNLRRWRMEGMIPFNRNALWNKRADLLLCASIGYSKTSSNLANPGSSSSPPTSPTPAAFPPLAAPLAAATPDPTPTDYDAPRVLGHMTERVQEAVEYITRKHEIGELTQTHVMAHLIRLQ
jgi:hypothetical protein